MSLWLQNYIIIVVMLGLEALVKVHQHQYWNHRDLTRPLNGIIFSDIKREDADKGLIECVKFFMNYTFYKFGLQVCLQKKLYIFSVNIA